jgi:hypothetical protein
LRHWDNKQIQKALKLLVSRSVRFLIVGNLGSGTLESHYSQAGKLVREGSITNCTHLTAYMSAILPTDETFRAAFSQGRVSQNYWARYYLRALEKQSKGENHPEFVPNPDEAEVNLEHVLPQKPSTAWDYISADLKRSYTKRLGNLALLKEKVNARVSNDSFESKHTYYEASDFELTKQLAEYSSWGPAEIDDRQGKLAALAVKAWPRTI